MENKSLRKGWDEVGEEKLATRINWSTLERVNSKREKDTIRKLREQAFKK